MAVVNTKSTAVTNADAATQTNISLKIAGGRLRESVGTVEAVNGDSIGSTFRLARIRSNDRVSRVMLSCDAISSCAGDVGIYDIAAIGGAVVDADFFASAQSLASALVNADVTHEADAADAGAGFGHADVEKPLWQALGLAADPYKLYDIAVTLTAAAAANGTIAMKVQYVNGN
jgi:hypothetical protein